LPDGADATFLRWLAGYTLTMTAVYCAIPYKTPWCLLGFLQGMTLLAGVGAVALVRAVPGWPVKGLVALALLAAAGQLGWQAYRASYLWPADPKNPYVYVPTLPDAERLYSDIEELIPAIPPHEPTSVQLIWHDPYYWPLPWYLRGFRNVRYWTRLPEDPSAPIVICSPPLDAALTEKLDDTHLMTDYYGVRPNVLALLWVRMDVWEAHLRRKGRL
jgi:predicted membrane-bound mannosyltransferase